MPAADALVGLGLTPSPYSELSTKYEALSAGAKRLGTEYELVRKALARCREERAWTIARLKIIEPDQELSGWTDEDALKAELTKYRAVRTKYCG